MAIQNQIELDFEKQLVDHKNHSELQRLNLQAAFTYVTEGTKAAFLLNGAAAIALMTFIGGRRISEWPAVDMARPLATFAVGAALAVFTLGIAYLSQSFFVLMNVQRRQRSKPAEMFQLLGVASFVGSTALFVLGLFRAAAAIDGKFSALSVIGL